MFLHVYGNGQTSVEKYPDITQMCAFNTEKREKIQYMYNLNFPYSDCILLTPQMTESVILLGDGDVVATYKD